MGHSPHLDANIRDLIARIRDDIAAAWEQLEAGRAILARSAWLLRRWRAQAAAGAPTLVPQAGHDSVAGGFVFAEPESEAARHAAAPPSEPGPRASL
jgi:hypothetical protein